MNAAHIPAATACSYPRRDGNHVRPLISSSSAFHRIERAIEEARHSIWLTVTFYADDFRFPAGRSSLFDMLDRAVARGLDVRILFWRHNPESSAYGRTFWGTAEQRDMLRSRGSRVRMRWDRAAGAFCQHQKSWVFDAGTASETAFVGGINPTAAAFGRHDAYVEVTGPSATDVHHNFAQRWNGASERHVADGNWGCDGADELPMPVTVSAAQGKSIVQIQRMLHPGRYPDIMQGERSVLEQYLAAFDAARRTIYLENQALPIPLIAEHLLKALERGVEIILLVPAIPEDHVFAARRNPERRPLFETIEALGRHPTFRLAGIARREEQARRPAYVHGKLAIVDDSWATIGSCNLHAYSLGGSSEMNASIWDPAVANGLRQALFAQHLGRPTEGLDDVQALRLFREIADENARRNERKDPDWQGQAFTLSAAAYGI